MKKQTGIIIAILVLMLLLVAFAVTQNVQKQKKVMAYNGTYEKHYNQIVYGTDVASIMNRAMNENEQNFVEQDEKGYYIDNNTNSIKIYIKLQAEGDFYPMERIVSLGITEFVKNFNIEDFKCTQINYHKDTGLVSEVYYETI